MIPGAPFSPSVASATTGATVKVTANNTPTSVSGTISAAISASCNAIWVVNAGSVVVFVRISAEATPTATAADFPLPSGTGRTLMNPNIGGAIGLAVLSSTASTNDIYFAPGSGTP